ncbi:MAG: hypothetical protein IPK50_03795 [Fibrobacterota bacterium]|nr:hypothetical protein [Fibrobacterota bacterium]QQS06017.1 MAG: hypothetical protein IPK50_03795 [Fibrobacterota bacterium]
MRRPSLAGIGLSIFSASLLAALWSCDSKESANPVEVPIQNLSGKVIDIGGAGISGVEVALSRSGRRTLTDTNGHWSLARPSETTADTFRLSIAGTVFVSLPLSSGADAPTLLRLVRRKALGQIDSSEFPRIGDLWIPQRKMHRVQFVLERNSHERVVFPATYDSISGSFSKDFWTLDGDPTQVGKIWAEVVDSIGIASRTRISSFGTETGDIRLATIGSSNLVATAFPLTEREWRSRDTSRVVLAGLDTSLVGRIFWRTSIDTTWQSGEGSLLVRCPSATDPALMVYSKIVTKEGRVTETPGFTFVPDSFVSRSYARTRFRTPPSLNPTYPDSAAIGDSVWISFGATDTLGGKVVRRYLHWNWGERTVFTGDSMKIVLPDRRSENSFGATLVVVDDEGDSAGRYIYFRMIPPAPSMEVRNLPSGGIHVGWQRPWKGNVTAFHLKFLDSTAGILLLDTVIHDTGVRSFDLPRFFFSRAVHIMGRYQEWWGEEHSAWAVHVDTLNSTPVNPIHVKTGTWTYRSHIYEPNQSSYSNCGLANNLPLIPTTDSGAVLCYQPQPIGVEFSYALALQILSPLHVSDSVVVDILTQDSVSLQVRLGSLSIDTQSVWLGWMPRTAGSGKHVFRLSDLRIYAQDDNMIDSPVLLPTGWHGLGESQILKEARKASRLDIVAPCAIQDGKCKDIPGGLVQLKTIQTF